MSRNRQLLHEMIDKLPNVEVFNLLNYVSFIKGRYDFIHYFKKDGIVVKDHGNAQSLRIDWETEFTSSISDSMKHDIHFNEFLWHVFSNKLLCCLEGKEAKEAFDEIKKDICYVFYQNHDFAWKLECANTLEAEDFMYQQDIYVVDSNYKWTYVNTHEREYGPYFYKQSKI
ncbi:DUF4275 family protein [Cytobacillus sp. IB215316]|uniref:DUF4275 family protein n=1 Tax=Cytobacillus sp. IB215316 TaxID=3097354 RepID=UPI002A12DB05|nr:DUF4275 family protein [Cytobacillus sp. IB215316]MDX8363512.1 DUF4275 family protein [Cytobacillus sp. IB215316]